MGNLLQAVQAKLNELDRIKNSPAPPPQSDPHQVMADLKKRVNADRLKEEVGSLLINGLRRLPKEKQDEFYERCIQQDRRRRFTKQVYERRLDPNTTDGKNQKTWLINSVSFGQDWQKTVETLEEMLGPEESERIIAAIPGLKTPDDPDFKREDKLVHPHAAELEALKKTLPADAAEDIRLLDEVNEDLAVVPNNILEYFDSLDRDRPPADGLQSRMNGFHYDAQNEFIDGVDGGRFKQKFPTIASKKAKSGFFYGMANVSASESGLSDQDIEDIKALKINVPQGLKEDLISITDRMDKLGVENFQVPGTSTEAVAGGEPGEQRFRSEQGLKNYAYWPLAKARQRLVQAVQEKDLDRIRDAHEAYRNTKKEMDGMLQTVRRHPTGICSGNINSTRPETQENPVPLEHLEDFVGHSQVNGVFCLYALSKNLKTSVAEILEDPSPALSRNVKEHIQKHGLHTQKTAGAKLLMGLSSSASGANFAGQWSDTGMLCNRAFESVASLAEDPKDRARILGTASLAIGAASYELSKYAEKWQSLSEMSAEKQTVLYQYALLLPEEEFDPIALANDFARNDWKKRLDPGKLIDRLKKEGGLDVAGLAERVETIAQEADDANDAMNNTKYDEDSLRFAAFDLFKTIREKTGPDDPQSEALQSALKASTDFALGTDSFARAQDELTRTFDVQRVRKSGWFLSSADTQEHQRMTRAQDTLRCKIMQMQGKELPVLPEEETAALRTMSLQEALTAARNATFDYCAKKTDNGRKASFLHEAGENRYEAARRSIQVIDTISDVLGLRTPVQKAMEDEQLDILDSRCEKNWIKEQTERKAAKTLYAMMLDSQDTSPDSQRKRLDPNRLEQGIAYIRGQAAFKEMFRAEGAEKIADHIVSGGGQLTNAYIRAMKSVDEKQKGGKGLKDPKEMTPDEKNRVLKETPLQV